MILPPFPEPLPNGYYDTELMAAYALLAIRQRFGKGKRGPKFSAKDKTLPDILEYLDVPRTSVDIAAHFGIRQDSCAKELRKLVAQGKVQVFYEGTTRLNRRLQ